MDEHDLVQRAQAGDRCAFAKLLRQHQDIAFRAAFLVTANAADAEDALQDGFLNAFQALERFDRSRPFRPWLLRIVTNTARNRRRSATRQERLRLQLAQSKQMHGASPEAEVIAAQQRDELMQALVELPDLDRLILTYRYFLDLSIAEMAELFDCPLSTMRSRLLRARERLRAHLSQPDTTSGERTLKEA